jgi:putative transcriptional regulator
MMPTATRNAKSKTRPSKRTVERDNGKPRGGAKRKPKKHSAFGLEIIAGLDEILETLEAGGMAAVEKKFTVHRVKRIHFDKPAMSKADVLAIRTTLGASQPVFASLLGVSVATVRAWEQGVNAPSGIATRFLAEVRDNPDYWKARLRAAASA